MGLIVVGRINSEHSLQISLTKDQHVVQALAAHDFNAAFHLVILPWRPWRDRVITNPHGPEPPYEYRPVCSIIITH